MLLSEDLGLGFASLSFHIGSLSFTLLLLESLLDLEFLLLLQT